MTRIPDISAFVATRADVEWERLPDGRIAVKKRKFGEAGSKLLKAFKVDPMLTVRFDSLGSAAWEAFDGKKTVGDVLQAMHAKFPDEEDLGPRLGQFMSTLVSNDLVELRPAGGEPIR